MIVIFLGAPGSGKGSHSKLLEKDLNLKHLSTGDLLRNKAKENDELALYIKSKIDIGDFVSDEVILKIIEEELNKKSNKSGYIFDGYPRNIAQAIKFDELMKKIGREINYVINLDIDEKVIIERVTLRRICNCGMMYHLKNNPPAKENVCNECGSSLIQRSDDNLESVKLRIEKYYELTKPVIDYYTKKGIIINIDARRNLELVHQDIMKVLEV